MGNEHLWEEIRPTARGMSEHFEDFGLSIDDLRGKKILDIGSGLNQLANELKEDNLDITSLDPLYALSAEEREALYEDYEDGSEELQKLLHQLKSENRSSKLVAGRSDALPFANDSFDLIISHYGSPFYAEDAEKVTQFFSELNRVLRSGGEARIYPTWLRNSDIKKSAAVKKCLKDLEEGGFHIEQIGSSWMLKKS
ncbi:MAG: methyltransferase domain-containing protein [bacterium]|nr:methyltransferase domain-containing protein [bacterium]